MEINLNKATKKDLVDLLNKFEQESATNLAAANNAITIANYFGSKLSIIEQLLLPLSKKGLGKTILFVITNWKQLRTILQEILTHLQEWREKVTELTTPKPEPAKEL